MKHAHTWGSRGRQPRAGDLCLTCPCEWSERGRGGQFMTDDYKPRTVAHVPQTSVRSDTLDLDIREPGECDLPGSGQHLTGGADMGQGTRSTPRRKRRAA